MVDSIIGRLNQTCTYALLVDSYDRFHSDSTPATVTLWVHYGRIINRFWVHYGRLNYWQTHHFRLSSIRVAQLAMHSWQTHYIQWQTQLHTVGYALHTAKLNQIWTLHISGTHSQYLVHTPSTLDNGTLVPIDSRHPCMLWIQRYSLYPHSWQIHNGSRTVDSFTKDDSRMVDSFNGRHGYNDTHSPGRFTQGRLVDSYHSRMVDSLIMVDYA